MAVSKWIVFALDLGPPLALGAHSLLIWNPGSLKGPRVFQRGLVDS